MDSPPVSRGTSQPSARGRRGRRPMGRNSLARRGPWYASPGRGQGVVAMPVPRKSVTCVPGTQTDVSVRLLRRDGGTWYRRGSDGSRCRVGGNEPVDERRCGGDVVRHEDEVAVVVLLEKRLEQGVHRARRRPVLDAEEHHRAEVTEAPI